MDRNLEEIVPIGKVGRSLSARRAWIEILIAMGGFQEPGMSLSARRAWIEMQNLQKIQKITLVALRKESVDRNAVCTRVVS